MLHRANARTTVTRERFAQLMTKPRVAHVPSSTLADGINIRFGSGTPRMPLVVTERQGHRARMCHIANHLLQIGPDDRIMYGLALHIGPFVAPLVQAILAGAAFCLYDPDEKGASIGKAVAAMRPTLLWVPPKKAGFKIEDYQGHDLASLHTAFIFGYTPEAELRDLNALLPNGSVVLSWSMRESMLICSCSRHDPLDKRLGTIGRPLAGIARVVAGELQIAGDFVADHKGKDACFTPDGWFRTGDAAELDGDGYLIVRGRLAPPPSAAGPAG